MEETMCVSPPKCGMSANRTALCLLLTFVATVALTLSAINRLDAALPPPFEIWRQFGIVISEPAIPRVLADHGLVDRIERIDGAYRVHAGKCFVEVKLVAEPPGSRT